MTAEANETGRVIARPSAAPTGYLKMPRPTPAQAVLDRAALMARVGDDQALLHELIGIFLEDCPKWLEEIQLAVRCGDARHLKLHAHLLGGTASNFGAH